MAASPTNSVRLHGLSSRSLRCHWPIAAPGRDVRALRAGAAQVESQRKENGVHCLGWATKGPKSSSWGVRSDRPVLAGHGCWPTVYGRRGRRPWGVRELGSVGGVRSRQPTAAIQLSAASWSHDLAAALTPFAPRRKGIRAPRCVLRIRLQPGLEASSP